MSGRDPTRKFTFGANNAAVYRARQAANAAKAAANAAKAAANAAKAAANARAKSIKKKTNTLHWSKTRRNMRK